MHTTFLGKEEIHAYLREFAGRLLKMDAPPLVWCPIGGSGNALARELLGVFPSLQEDVATPRGDQGGKTRVEPSPRRGCSVFPAGQRTNARRLSRVALRDVCLIMAAMAAPSAASI